MKLRIGQIWQACTNVVKPYELDWNNSITVKITELLQSYFNSTIIINTYTFGRTNVGETRQFSSDIVNYRNWRLIEDCLQCCFCKKFYVGAKLNRNTDVLVCWKCEVDI